MNEIVIDKFELVNNDSNLMMCSGCVIFVAVGSKGMLFITPPDPEDVLEFTSWLQIDFFSYFVLAEILKQLHKNRSQSNPNSPCPKSCSWLCWPMPTTRAMIR